MRLVRRRWRFTCHEATGSAKILTADHSETASDQESLVSQKSDIGGALDVGEIHNSVSVHSSLDRRGVRRRDRVGLRSFVLFI